eukprot:CAMPEP_0185801620 /NCGR_PEP_ID=MMETSP1322-20130828/1531_1 /TAXON_ID=265543 /ORGANISM="Minutocellus polymorphus, Strain RCC2270" /LENGTH=666 /DNA_ID=CAMNT_0028497325 /DNA_START=285 /DNA_END=2285 /DNA_ORIENTATION=+
MVFGALKKSKASKGGGEAEHAGELVSKPTSSNTSSKKKSGLISPANTEPVSPSPDKKKANKSSSKDKSSSADKDKSSTSKQSKSSSTMSDSRRRLVRDVRALSESDEELTVAILSRLVQATRSSSARTDFVEASGIQSLVAAMVRYKRCLKVVEGGCIILQNLAVDPTHRRLLVQNSAVKAIVGGMKDHPSDESIQELGCAALRNLGSGADAATKASISAGGGILVVVHAMRRHAGSEAVQEQGLRALRNLAKDSSGNKVAIAGTVPVIIEAMGLHGASEPVQREGCATLRNLSVSADNQVAIAACGGVTAITSALISISKVEKVQVQGTGALFNLSFSPMALANLKKEKRLKKALKGAAKRFPDSCEKYCDGILDRLPYATDDAKATQWPIPIDTAKSGSRSKKSGGENALTDDVSPTLKILSHIHRLEDHTTSTEDESKVAIAELARLAVSYDHRIAISAAGGIPVIIDTMAQRIDSPSIQRVGCSAIQNLSCNEDNEVAIAESGGIAAIISGMDLYVDNVKLQHKACAALRNLAASNNDNRTAIRRDGGTESIITAMRAHDEQKHVQEVACSALGNLCLQNDDNRVAIVAAGALPRIMLALMTHTEVAGVQEKGCRALYNLSVSPENVRAIREEEPETVLWDAASKFPNECGEWSRKLLEKLT